MANSLKIESLALVEDDINVRDFLAEQISLQIELNDLRVYDNGLVAVKELTKNPVEIALFDINLPGMNGIQCIQQLKILHPKMQIVVLTVYDNSTTIFEALKAGATGYLLKTTPMEKIVESIYVVMQGGSPISSQIARKVIETFRTKEVTNELFQDLSRREKEILELLSNGYRYKEIAQKLFLSIDTVRTHVRNIYEKLQVNSRAEALRKTGLL